MINIKTKINYFFIKITNFLKIVINLIKKYEMINYE